MTNYVKGVRPIHYSITLEEQIELVKEARDKGYEMRPITIPGNIPPSEFKAYIAFEKARRNNSGYTFTGNLINNYKTRK